MFVGEIADVETAWAALTAADTGQLVISTMATTNATETVSRMIELFPPHRQRQVRSLLATVLRGTVSLRLLERADGSGRVPAVEVLVGTGRVFDVIVDPEHATESLEDSVGDGEYYGMQTFDQSLFGLYKNGLVSLRDALGASVASPRLPRRVAASRPPGLLSTTVSERDRWGATGSLGLL